MRALIDRKPVGYCAGKPIEKKNIFCFYLKLVYKSNKLHAAHDLQALLVFSQHPVSFLTPVNP